jgi:Cu/Ag efflux protein CusF
MTLTAGAQVKNFDQLKGGDAVDIEYVAALTLELKKGGGMPVQRTTKAGAVGATPGQAPGGALGRQVTVVADVVAVDTAKKTVTLKGPKQTVELPVQDPELLKNVAKGDQVEATYTQALAMVVVPKAK